MSPYKTGLSVKDEKAADIRMSLFLVMFLAGWNDASQGPLLPSLQEYYNVNYTISALSLLWNSSKTEFKYRQSGSRTSEDSQRLVSSMSC